MQLSVLVKYTADIIIILSHQNVTCTRYGIAEKIPTWREPTITHYE